MFQFNLEDMTADELVELGRVLGCTTKNQIFDRMDAAFRMAKETGDVELDMVLPMLWLAKRAIDPTFTYEQAKSIGIRELAVSLPAPSTKVERSPRSALATGMTKPKNRRK